MLVGKLRTEPLGFDEEEASIDSTVGELVRALCYGRGVEGRALECGDEVTEGGELRQLFDGDTRLSRLDGGGNSYSPCQMSPAPRRPNE